MGCFSLLGAQTSPISPTGARVLPSLRCPQQRPLAGARGERPRHSATSRGSPRKATTGGCIGARPRFFEARRSATGEKEVNFYLPRALGTGRAASCSNGKPGRSLLCAEKSRQVVARGAAPGGEKPPRVRGRLPSLQTRGFREGGKRGPSVHTAAHHPPARLGAPGGRFLRRKLTFSSCEKQKEEKRVNAEKSGCWGRKLLPRLKEVAVGIVVGTGSPPRPGPADVTSRWPGPPEPKGVLSHQLTCSRYA